MTGSTATPRAVWERAQACIHVRDVDGYAGLFAPDGVQSLPFAIPGMPTEIRGPDEIRARIGPALRDAVAAGRRNIGNDNVVVHETADPEVIVVEFDLLGEDGRGGAYRLPYIHVLRVRDGRIVSLRDYIDTLAMTRVIGAATTSGPTGP